MSGRLSTKKPDTTKKVKPGNVPKNIDKKSVHKETVDKYFDKKIKGKENKKNHFYPTEHLESESFVTYTGSSL